MFLSSLKDKHVVVHIVPYRRMPPTRCVVFGCSNKSDTKSGISIHKSPVNKTECDKWKRFVKLHRANFDQSGRFGVCSDHFEESCFSRSLHVEGSFRRLLPGSVPTKWLRKSSLTEQEAISNRSRRQVSPRNSVFFVFKQNFNSYRLSSVLFDSLVSSRK